MEYLPCSAAVSRLYALSCYAAISNFSLSGGNEHIRMFSQWRYRPDRLSVSLTFRIRKSSILSVEQSANYMYAGGCDTVGPRSWDPHLLEYPSDPRTPKLDT